MFVVILFLILQNIKKNLCFQFWQNFTNLPFQAINKNTSLGIKLDLKYIEAAFEETEVGALLDWIMSIIYYNYCWCDVDTRYQYPHQL